MAYRRRRNTAVPDDKAKPGQGVTEKPELLKVVPRNYGTGRRLIMHPLDAKGVYNLEIPRLPNPAKEFPALAVGNNSIGINNVVFTQHRGVDEGLNVFVEVSNEYLKLYRQYNGDISIGFMTDNGHRKTVIPKIYGNFIADYALPKGAKKLDIRIIFTPYGDIGVGNGTGNGTASPPRQPVKPKIDKPIEITPKPSRGAKPLRTDEAAKYIFDIPFPILEVGKPKRVPVPANPIGISAVEFSMTGYAPYLRINTRFTLSKTLLYHDYQGKITMTVTQSDGKVNTKPIQNIYDQISIAEVTDKITHLIVELTFDPIYVPSPDEEELIEIILSRPYETKHAFAPINTNVEKSDKFYFGLRSSQRLLAQTVRTNFEMYDKIINQLGTLITDDNIIRVLELSQKLKTLCFVDSAVIREIRDALGNFTFTYQQLIDEKIIDIIYDTLTGEETIDFKDIPNEPRIARILEIISKHFAYSFAGSKLVDPLGSSHYLSNRECIDGIVKVLSPEALIGLFETLASRKQFYLEKLEIEFLTNFVWMSGTKLFEKLYGEFYWEREPDQIDMLEEIYIKLVHRDTVKSMKQISKEIYDEYGLYLGDNPAVKFIEDMDEYLLLHPEPKSVEEYTEKQLFTRLKMILPHQSRADLNTKIRQFQKGEEDFFFIPLSAAYAAADKRYEGDEDREELITTYEDLEEAIENRTAIAIGNLKKCYITDPGELSMIILKSKADKGSVDTEFRDPRFGTDAQPEYFDEAKFLAAFYSAYGVCQMFRISYLIPEYDDKLRDLLNKEYENMHKAIKEILDFRRTLEADGLEFHKNIKLLPQEELDKIAHYLYILLYSALVTRGWKEHGFKLPMKGGEWGLLGALISDRINVILVEAATVEDTMEQKTKTVLNNLRAREYYGDKFAVDEDKITKIVADIRQARYCTRIASTKLVGTAAYFYDNYYNKKIQLFNDELYLGLDLKPLFTDEEVAEIGEDKFEDFSVIEFTNWGRRTTKEYYNRGGGDYF